jgi:predicted amidohydrolase
MKRGQIRVATCQFPSTGSARTNSARIQEQIIAAKGQKATIVHFHEAALTGYLGVDLESWEGYDWDLLRGESENIMALARRKRVWVVLGTAHPLSRGHLPHNSLYAISPEGRIVERYDKRFCTGGDLKFYSPGDHFSTFDVNGVKCGMLVCYDIRFPEMYREYEKLGAQCMFHSFYNARAKAPGIHKVIMRPTLQARAASNYIWVSATNSSAYYAWPSVFVQPDGTIAGQLRSNRSGVMTNLVDVNRELYDPSRGVRDLAMKGVFNTGKTVSDPRSRDRTSF